MESIELDIKIGGIRYNVELETEDGHVTAVNSVQVDTGTEFTDIVMIQQELDEFFARYEDELNDAYQAYLVATAEMNAEEKWELAEDR